MSYSSVTYRRDHEAWWVRWNWSTTIRYLYLVVYFSSKLGHSLQAFIGRNVLQRTSSDDLKLPVKLKTWFSGQGCRALAYQFSCLDSTYCASVVQGVYIDYDKWIKSLEVCKNMTTSQSCTKGWRQIHKIKQNRFFYGMFYSWFFAVFYPKTSKFGFSVYGWVLSIKPNHFKDFIKIS